MSGSEVIRCPQGKLELSGGYPLRGQEVYRVYSEEDDEPSSRDHQKEILKTHYARAKGVGAAC